MITMTPSYKLTKSLVSRRNSSFVDACMHTHDPAGMDIERMAIAMGSVVIVFYV